MSSFQNAGSGLRAGLVVNGCITFVIGVATVEPLPIVIGVLGMVSCITSAMTLYVGRTKKSLGLHLEEDDDSIEGLPKPPSSSAMMMMILWELPLCIIFLTLHIIITVMASQEWQASTAVHWAYVGVCALIACVIYAILAGNTLFRWLRYYYRTKLTTIHHCPCCNRQEGLAQMTTHDQEGAIANSGTKFAGDLKVANEAGKSEGDRLIIAE